MKIIDFPNGLELVRKCDKREFILIQNIKDGHSMVMDKIKFEAYPYDNNILDEFDIKNINDISMHNMEFENGDIFRFGDDLYMLINSNDTQSSLIELTGEMGLHNFNHVSKTLNYDILIRILIKFIHANGYQDFRFVININDLVKMYESN